MPVVFKKSDYSEAPKDAIFLSRQDASSMVFDSIDNIEFSKSWPVKLSLASIVGGIGMTGLLITTNVRKYFKLGKYGYFTAAIPAAYLPMMGGYAFYKYDLVTPILLQEKICPTCLQVKAMTAQFIAGVFYPFVSSYFMSYVTASNLGTVTAPQLKLMRYESARREMFDIFRRYIRKRAGSLVAMTIGQCILASGLVMLQMYTIDDILDHVEKKRLESIEDIARTQKKKQHEEQKMTNLSLL